MYENIFTKFTEDYIGNLPKQQLNDLQRVFKDYANSYSGNYNYTSPQEQAYYTQLARITNPSISNLTEMANAIYGQYNLGNRFNEDYYNYYLPNEQLKRENR